MNIKITITSLISFDNTSLINSISIKIPKAYRIFFDNKAELFLQNCNKIRQLFLFLDKHNIPKYRFIPSNFEEHTIRAINQLVGQGPLMLGNVLRKDFSDQMRAQIDNITKNFLTISTVNNFEDVKQFFITNERQLKRGKNIPEDNDLRIIKTLSLYPWNDKKYFVTFDEGFWGYKDLIEQHYGFTVIEEWNCHLVTIN